MHTPGPWTIDPANLGVCLQGHVPIDAPEHGGIAQVVWKMEDDETSPTCEANARLMAAAPDLLAALQELLADKYLSDPINRDRMANARAAIARATGKD